MRARNLRAIQIDVTAEDINNGVPNRCKLCPVALAATRALPNRGVEARSQGMWLFNPTEYVPFPQSARKFIASFDEGNKEEPLTFTVEIES